MISEWRKSWIENVLSWSSHILFWGTIVVFAWQKWGRWWNTSVMIANQCQVSQPLSGQPTLSRQPNSWMSVQPQWPLRCSRSLKLLTPHIKLLSQLIKKHVPTLYNCNKASFIYLFTVLFPICFGLYWAIIREIIHLLSWILLLALYLYHTSADKKYTSFCVWAKSIFAQCLR